VPPAAVLGVEPIAPWPSRGASLLATPCPSAQAASQLQSTSNIRSTRQWAGEPAWSNPGRGRTARNGTVVVPVTQKAWQDCGPSGRAGPAQLAPTIPRNKGQLGHLLTWARCKQRPQLGHARRGRSGQREKPTSQQQRFEHLTRRPSRLPRWLGSRQLVGGGRARRGAGTAG